MSDNRLAYAAIVDTSPIDGVLMLAARGDTSTDGPWRLFQASCGNGSDYAAQLEKAVRENLGLVVDVGECIACSGEANSRVYEARLRHGYLEALGSYGEIRWITQAEAAQLQWVEDLAPVITSAFSTVAGLRNGI